MRGMTREKIFTFNERSWPEITASHTGNHGSKGYAMVVVEVSRVHEFRDRKIDCVVPQ